MLIFTIQALTPIPAYVIHTSGDVEGALSDGRPYPDEQFFILFVLS
jgi:hypothetical protein